MSDASLQCQPICHGQHVPPGFPGSAAGVTGWFAKGLQSWDQDYLAVQCQVDPLAHPLNQLLVWPRVFCGTVLVAFDALHVQCPGVMCMCSVPSTGDCSVLGSTCVVFLVSVVS